MRIAYRFLVQSVGLLMLAAVAGLLASLQLLPNSTYPLPIALIYPLAVPLYDMVVIGGLIGGGIYATLPATRQNDSQILRIASILWPILIVLTLLAGIFGLLATLSAPLAILQAVVIALVVADVIGKTRVWTPIPLIWTVGMSISAIALLISLIPLSDFALAATITTLASGGRLYIGEVLAAMALIYWLIRRFSSAPSQWAASSLYTVAGMLALAGALVILGSVGLLANGIALIAPLLYLIFAAHTYAAFSKRNETNTLAAHWAALGVLLLVLGIGVLGAALAITHVWTSGTQLSALQPITAQYAITAVILGMVNQSFAEMRGQARRVTGLAPFWLIAFGMVGSGFALAGVGLAQVYLERMLGIRHAEAQTLLAPLYALWIAGLATLLIGVIVYGMIIWIRRPRRSA